MYSNAVFLEIRQLLDEGELSHRAIAARLHISRGVVTNIAAGRRGLRTRQTKHVRLSRDHSLGTPARCRHCGGLVYEPCLLCRTRNYQQKIQEIRRQAVRSQVSIQSPRRVA
jgi:hypothetical protein